MRLRPCRCPQWHGPQLGWPAPDWIVVPIGRGDLLAGIWKGFQKLPALGLVESLLRMVGVQAAGCAPLVRAWEEGVAPDAG